ncbi:MAG: hypothetical protein AB1401_00670 [Thermodesulfobacteriota bacterium]
MKIIGRHKCVAGATITESYDEKREGYKDILYRRFTATIRGWQNWKLFEGYIEEDTFEKVVNKAIEIRVRIDSGDETVFEHKGFWL